MIGWHPQNELQEKVHAVDAQAEYTEKHNLVVALHATEDGPIVSGPYVRFELVD